MGYTFVAMPDKTDNQGVIFAKNIETIHRTPVGLIRFPAQENSYEIIALQKTNTNGIEIGLNEFGIGGTYEILEPMRKVITQESLSAPEILKKLLENSKDFTEIYQNLNLFIDKYSLSSNNIKLLFSNYEKTYSYHLINNKIYEQIFTHGIITLEKTTHNKLLKEIAQENKMWFAHLPIKIDKIPEIHYQQHKFFIKHYSFSDKTGQLCKRWFWHKPLQHLDSVWIHFKYNYPTIWFSGTSGLMQQLFKPFFLGGKSILSQHFNQEILWQQGEKLLKRYAFFSDEEKRNFRMELQNLQLHFFQEEQMLNALRIPLQSRDVFSELCLIEHIEFLKKWLK